MWNNKEKHNKKNCAPKTLKSLINPGYGWRSSTVEASFTGNFCVF